MSTDNPENSFLRNLEEAKAGWQEQIAYLEKQLYMSSPDQRFGLRKKIEECDQEITRINQRIASLQKERQQKKSEKLDSLFQKIHDVPIVDRPLEIVGTSQKTEPVVAASWQEFMRLAISKLGQKNNQSEYSGLITADDVILSLLSANRSPREARALSSFAMQCLATEPDLKNETVYLVIDKAIENLNDNDGLSKSYTLIDQAFVAVMQSRFRQLLQERLLQSYIQNRDDRRNKIGGIFSNIAITDNEILNAGNATQILTPLLKELNISYSVEEQINAAFHLVEKFYRPQVQKNSTRIDFLPDLLLRKTIEVLLTAAQQDTESNYAVSTTAIWALSWLTSARNSFSYTTYTFADEELDILRQVVLNNKHDAFARSYSALILSVCIPGKNIFAQADWIYEWAVVADGGKSLKDVPKISHLHRPKDIEAIKSLIFSHLPSIAKRRVAIALGRLGRVLYTGNDRPAAANFSG